MVCGTLPGRDTPRLDNGRAEPLISKTETTPDGCIFRNGRAFFDIVGRRFLFD